MELSLTWKEATTILADHNVDYFFTNKRFSLVTKPFIESYAPPMIYLKIVAFKVEIVGVYLKLFEDWLTI